MRGKFGELGFHRLDGGADSSLARSRRGGYKNRARPEPDTDPTSEPNVGREGNGSRQNQ